MDRLRKLVTERLRARKVGPHPSLDLLAAFSTSALAGTERREVVSHLADCSECREIVFLAVPQEAAEQTALMFPANRRWGYALRWGTLAAMLVAGGSLLLNTWRQKPLSRTESAAKPASALQTTARLESPQELDQVRKTQEQKREAQLGVVADQKSLPAAKHMTAKPKATFRLDKDEQVHVAEENRPATAGPVVTAAAPEVESRQESKAGAAMADAAGSVNSLAVSGRAVPAPANAAQPAQASAERQQATSLQKDKVAYRAVANVAGSVAQPQWRLSAQGGVERSSDLGKTWQQVTIPGGTFEALSAVGSDVWVGGKSGVFYHSTDRGTSWARVVPSDGDRQLTGDISAVTFTDERTGRITTSSGEVWTTRDAGGSWRLETGN